jgi:hypothetical protein
MGRLLIYKRGEYMNQILTLNGTETQKVLKAFVGRKISAAMSYLSKGKWHSVRVVLAELEDEKLIKRQNSQG